MSAAESSRREDYTTLHLPPSARVLLATANEHKTREVRAILHDVLAPYGENALISLKGLPLASPVEDGITFEQNALIKARAAAKATGLPVLADDSGLAVDVLGGAPGVFSARWCGHHGDDVANLELLLDQLADVPGHHRGARFECSAVLVTPDGHEYSEHGLVTGALLFRPEGDGGFGYDPIFQPTGYSRSMADLTAEEKNQISHRAKAFSELKDELASVLARG
ncbi:MAG: RdgB/HAM1 family non-canonical purine NTP pyrophosphatase [Ruaniaceae bacterium]|nr:RdgB/HAM1 family non-canonical purine NTP pyrophosphatase [Ruaniaceae bacterium]